MATEPLTEPDKPLHVRVAEALGCTVVGVPSLRPEDHGEIVQWRCSCEGSIHGVSGPCRSVDELPEYDTDWGATGPLIERFHVELTPPGPPDGENDWGATVWDPPVNERGDTPLVAVCNLIIALSAAGKLKEGK